MTEIKSENKITKKEELKAVSSSLWQGTLATTKVNTVIEINTSMRNLYLKQFDKTTKKIK